MVKTFEDKFIHLRMWRTDRHTDIHTQSHRHRMTTSRGKNLNN